jgi:hypothetical protein
MVGFGVYMAFRIFCIFWGLDCFKVLWHIVCIVLVNHLFILALTFRIMHHSFAGNRRKLFLNCDMEKIIT